MIIRIIVIAILVILGIIMRIVILMIIIHSGNSNNKINNYKMVCEAGKPSSRRIPGEIASDHRPA